MKSTPAGIQPLNLHADCSPLLALSFFLLATMAPVSASSFLAQKPLVSLLRPLHLFSPSLTFSSKCSLTSDLQSPVWLSRVRLRVLLLPQELWALFDFICKGRLLGSRAEFKELVGDRIARVCRLTGAPFCLTGVGRGGGGAPRVLHSAQYRSRRLSNLANIKNE